MISSVVKIFTFTGSIFALLWEAIREDLAKHPVEWGPWITAMVYFTAMIYFSVPGFKSFVIATIILLSCWNNYGKRTLSRTGIVVLFFTLFVWAGIIPEPANWSPMAHAFVAGWR